MMTYNPNSNSSSHTISRHNRAFNVGMTMNWPPSYRTIEGSLSSIPGSLMGTSYISGPTIYLPDYSAVNSAAE